jgi:hypothetical protein
MKELPGHYLGSVVNYAADTPWDLEYSLVLDPNGHYQFYSRTPEGIVRNLNYIDSGFAADFADFLERRNAR